MTTKLITVEYLMTAGRNTPCQEEIKKFTKLFGKKGVRATKANIKRARKAGLNLEWLIVSWLPIEAADKYWADLKTIANKYWADRKPLDDKYWADRKTIANKYWADRKPLDDKYRADRKTIDDKYSADRKPLDDKYWADRKTIEIEIVYQYLNA